MADGGFQVQTIHAQIRMGQSENPVSIYHFGQPGKVSLSMLAMRLRLDVFKSGWLS